MLTADREKCAKFEWLPGKLLSLWEIVEMQLSNPGGCFGVLQSLARLSQVITDAHMWRGQGEIGIDKSMPRAIIPDLHKLAGELDRLGFSLAAVSAIELANTLGRATKIEGPEVKIPFLLAKEVEERIRHVTSRIKDELAVRTLMIVSQNDSKLFAISEPLFGKKVADKFPKASEDISEAAKCMALGRTTACVFHLMRAMETAVKRLGKKLRVTLIDWNNKELAWGPILGNINDAIKAMPRGPKREKWSEAWTLLYHVKETWRNDTMHPKQTYTEQEASDVFAATKAFMAKLAILV